MMTKLLNKSIFMVSALMVLSVAASAKVRIVASLPDLGSIAAYIGGDKVSVSSITNANANPHSVEVFPSYMAKVSQAAIYLKCGLELDQWADAIIDGSRNNKLTVVDCSNGIDVLEKPTGKVDASKGDVHPFGNPHYWLNPANGIIIAQNILAGLQKVDPDNAPVYQANYHLFEKDCRTKITAWQDALKPLAGSKILSYHSSWVYFASAFNFTLIGMVEPFPGIPPSGNHLAQLIDVIKKEHAAFLIQEPYFPDEAPKFLHRETGIPVLKYPPACKGVNPDDYFAHFEGLVKAILQQVKGS